jgi:hypothetical protein
MSEQMYSWTQQTHYYKERLADCCQTLASQMQCSFAGHDQSGSSSRLLSAAFWSNFRMAYPRSAYIRLTTLECSAPSCTLLSPLDLKQVLVVFIPELLRDVLVLSGLDLDLERVARRTRVRCR